MAFYYDTDNTGPTVSPQPTVRQPPRAPASTCAWDTTGVTPGDYYIYGITDDGIAAQVSSLFGRHGYGQCRCRQHRTDSDHQPA